MDTDSSTGWDLAATESHQQSFSRAANNSVHYQKCFSTQTAKSWDSKYGLERENLTPFPPHQTSEP